MSIQKPTADELKQWEDQLKDDGLSMDRGYNGHKLNYGYDDSDSLVRGWDDVKIYTRQKRKPHAKAEKPCVVCGSTFLGRADAKCCGAVCRKRLERSHRKSSH